MANEDTINVFGYLIKRWHPLTERPESRKNVASEKTVTAVLQTNPEKQISQLLSGTSETLRKVLWDILVYHFSTISVRIKRLGISTRAFERAKEDGLEHGFIIESKAGGSIYLLPTAKSFTAYNMQSPFAEGDLLEHSYYSAWCEFLIQKNPRYKSVKIGVRIGEGNAAADLVSVTHDSNRQAWEITLSATNILSNCTKYINMDFEKIIFLCRDHRLSEAVRACCREGQLPSDLLAKLEFMHFAQFFQMHRKLAQY